MAIYIAAAAAEKLETLFCPLYFSRNQTVHDILDYGSDLRRDTDPAIHFAAHQILKFRRAIKEFLE